MSREQDQRFLELARELAQMREGSTAPNPAVGAVVVRDGVVMGSGYHWGAGYPHAEVTALEGLIADVTREATLYCTLEPCCHYGRTPPCTELIKQSGLSRVVYGHVDPNPLVSRSGILALEQAGIRCDLVELDSITELYRAYDYWTRRGLPFLEFKMALSLDGKIALERGAPTPLSGGGARAWVHRKRKTSDAILTTSATVTSDDPLLNVRLEEPTTKPIWVLDQENRLRGTERIFQTGAPVTRVVALSTAARDELSSSISTLAVDSDDFGLDLLQVAKAMGAAGLHRVWCEAGARLFDSLLKARLIRRAHFILCPKILGPASYAGFQSAFDLSGGVVSWSPLGEDALCSVEWP